MDPHSKSQFLIKDGQSQDVSITNEQAKSQFIGNYQSNSSLIPPETPKENTPNDGSKIKLSRKIRWFIFYILTGISICSNIDGGVIPAATTELEKQFFGTEGKNSLYIGYFGSVDYLGRIIGSLIFVGMINKVNRRIILIITLFFKAFTLFIPIFSKQDYIVNLIARGISGFSQVYYTIYLPVWSDQYGPKDWKTLMITFIQLGVPAGIAIGYTICTLIGKNWVTSFCIEGIILGVLGVLLIFMPQLYFSNNLMLVEGSSDELREMSTDNENKVETSETIQNNQQPAPRDIAPQQPAQYDIKSQSPASTFQEVKEPVKKREVSFCQNLKVMLTEMVFLFTGLANSVAFFGTAVVQFWGGDFMENVLKFEDASLRVILFGALCITGPPSGIAAGGLIGTKVGGYTKKKAMWICVLFTIFECGFGLPLGLTKNKYIFCVFVWLFFFFIGAIIPIETGIIISSIPENVRGDGFSVMNFMLNLLGNLPAPLIYGFIKDRLKSQLAPMLISMCYNFTGLVFIIIASFFRFLKPDNDEEQKTEDSPQGEKEAEEEQRKTIEHIQQVYGGYANPTETVRNSIH